MCARIDRGGREANLEALYAIRHRAREQRQDAARRRCDVVRIEWRSRPCAPKRKKCAGKVQVKWKERYEEKGGQRESQSWCEPQMRAQIIGTIQ